MKNLKKVFESSTLEVFKIKEKSIAKKAFLIDCADNELFYCIDESTEFKSNLLTAEELRDRVENDNRNSYRFTKEAYIACKKYFANTESCITA